MLDLTHEILPLLRSHQIDGLLPGKNLILPNYRGYSLVNLPSTICHLLNAPAFGAQKLAQPILDPIDGAYDNVIFLLVDGMRLNFLREFLDRSPWNRVMANTVFSPITSICPSTTSAALTTLWTGRHASEHGVVGYEVWLREYGLVANMILHSAFSFQGDMGGLQRAGFDPLKFLPVPTLGPHLNQNGIHPYALQNISIAYSGLSKMLFPGVDVIPYRSQMDLFVSLEELFRKKTNERKYAYIYWETIDTLSHRFGPDNERNRREFEHFSYCLISSLENIAKISGGKTLFILSADHGFVHTPILSRYNLSRYDEINRKLVMAPTGENRLPYLFLKSGSDPSEVIHLIRKYFQEDFSAISSKSAVELGLFGHGALHPNLEERLGDWVLIPQEQAYLWWSPNENSLLGRHGGLSQEEMLIPFLAITL
jgi:predicted AlkP superfamily pyrophosphatase or phosphodiesterase